MGKFAAVIVCAGLGKRLGKIDKPLLKINGIPLFCYTVNIFQSVSQFAEIIVVLRKEHFSLAKRLLTDPRIKLVEGGKERYHSVFNGLQVLSKDIKQVLIHDGARPFVTPKIIRNVILELKKHHAVICSVPVVDTVKEVKKGFVQKTLKRETVVAVQTPQGFDKELIMKAYARAKKRKVYDDAQLVESLGVEIKVIDGERKNIKITYPEDLKGIFDE